MINTDFISIGFCLKSSFFIIIDSYMSTYKNSPYSNSTYMCICETANMYISKSNVCTSDNMKICDIFDSIFSGR